MKSIEAETGMVAEHRAHSLFLIDLKHFPRTNTPEHTAIVHIHTETHGAE